MHHAIVAAIAAVFLVLAALEFLGVLPAKAMAVLVFAFMLMVFAVAIYGGIVDRQNRIEAERHRNRSTPQ